MRCGLQSRGPVDGLVRHSYLGCMCTPNFARCAPRDSSDTAASVVRPQDAGISVAASTRANIAEDRKKLKELAGQEKEAAKNKRKRGGPAAGMGGFGAPGSEDDPYGAGGSGGGSEPPPPVGMAAAAAGVGVGMGGKGLPAAKRIKLPGQLQAAAAAKMEAARGYGGVGGYGENGAEEEDLGEDEPEPVWDLPEEVRMYMGDPEDKKALWAFRARQAVSGGRGGAGRGLPSYVARMLIVMSMPPVYSPFHLLMGHCVPQSRTLPLDFAGCCFQAERNNLERARAKWHANQRRRARLRDARQRATEEPGERAAREKREAEEALAA